jgi:hypothetical protein
MGPLLAAFQTTTKPWPTPFWVYFALTTLGLVLTVTLVRETYYDRTIPAAEQPSVGSRVSSVVGLAQWKSRHLRNSPSEACWRVFSVLLKPVVFLICIFYLLVGALSYPTIPPVYSTYFSSPVTLCSDLPTHLPLSLVHWEY